MPQRFQILSVLNVDFDTFSLNIMMLHDITAVTLR